jgi:hypothetical protein
VEDTKEGISWFDSKRRLLAAAFLFCFVLFCFICLFVVYEEACLLDSFAALFYLDLVKK